MRSRAVLAGLVGLSVTLLASHLRSTPYNNYVLLANALLHGHAWIDWPGAYIDALGYHGQHYVIEAPMPAILLLPYVAVAGTAANQTLLSVLLAGIAIGAAWRLGERIGIPASANIWLCTFLLGGTDLLWCAMLGDVWFIAHVSAVCFTLLALVELCGRRRGWLVALWAVCAAESRFTMALALPVYAVLLVAGTPLPDRLRVHARTVAARIGGFAGVLAVAAALWVWYNVARWGTPADIGYTNWYHEDSAGSPTGSPFQLQYLRYQLWSFFQQYPEFSPEWPWFRPGYSGVALTWTSPALIYAFAAARPAAFVAALWAAAILTAIPNFVYYVNGYAQYGMRHALDFIPFLFALMCVAARDRLPVWTKVLIVYSLAAGLYGVWFWNAFVRTNY
ncbi:MAG TPA: hypothetical protein VGZ02_01480 [Candidatus Baltobacteraceae bacterium]|jgi:hypothetical protein|nr:hypothetical protein [Candidatus Baltobacteraceae bacterium]